MYRGKKPGLVPGFLFPASRGPRYLVVMSTIGHPRGRESSAWVWTGIWLIFIYGSILLARTVQENLALVGARMIFLWLTLIVFGLAASWFVYAFARRMIVFTWPRALGLALIGGIFIRMTWALRANPEEAFHFVQYGLLGILLFRALRFRLADGSVYIVAALIGAAAGILDELIQWITPRRYFDFRDIGLNVLSGVLVQVAIALAVKPDGVSGSWSIRGRRSICRAGLFVALLLFFCVANTPRFKAWYEKFIPAAALVSEVTAEYGYRIEDPSVGMFFSRLPAGELRRQNELRGAEVAAMLNKVRSDEAYHRFVARNSGFIDPFAFEARVHIFRRDRYAAGMNKSDRTPEEKAYNAWVAQSEHRILASYFPAVLENSVHAWSAAQEEAVAAMASCNDVYVSGVGRHLLTRVDQTLVQGALLLIMFALVVAERRLARREHA